MSQDSRGPDRRSVLRSIAVAAGATTVGSALFTGTVAATCAPRTPGYWGNHDFPATALPGSSANRLYKVTEIEQDQEAWQAFLLQPTRGDKAIILGQHLVATVLNFQYRTGSSDDCVRQEIDGYDWTVEEVKERAADWLAASAWPEGRQSSWTVEVDGEMVDGEQLKNVLDAFNNDPSQLGLDCSVENCPIQGGPDGNGAPGQRRGN